MSNRFLVAYFIFALLIAPIHLLSFDSYYYWEWSRHLAWSYYDGSPMVAYLMRVFTECFGDNLFALNTTGIVVTALTSVIVYRTSRLFLEQEASMVAACLWLFSPLITLDLLNQVTLNTPLTLFWALTLYYCIRYLTQAKPYDLYWIGLNCGFMLLSKYSGIVLVCSLMIFLLQTSYRKLFFSPALYGAGLLAAMIFSPVILWNAQHHWQSFIYQLHTHHLQSTFFSLGSVGHTACTTIISALNIMLLPPLLYHLNRQQATCLPAQFCFSVSISFLLFYIVLAGFAQLRGFWLSHYLLSASLLAGFCYQHYGHQVRFRQVITLFAAISIAILINATTYFNVNDSKKVAYYHWIQPFNQSLSPPPDAIVTTGWFAARGLFFLKHHPSVYTLACGEAQNQYAAWSEPFLKQIAQNKIQRIWYFDLTDHSDCIKRYFATCQPLREQSSFIAYECTRPTAQN